MSYFRMHAIIFLFLISFVVYANENACIPYSFIYDRLIQINELKYLDRVETQLKLSSNEAEIPLENIQLSLLLKDKKLSFMVDKNGYIDLPLVKEWKKYDYYLESNQPAGSLQLNLSFVGKFPKKSEFPYQEIVEITSQFKKAMKSQSGMLGLFMPRVSGIELQYPKDENASVYILSKKEELQYATSSNGIIQIPLNSKLKKENPVVKVSRMPKTVTPWIKK